MTGFLRDARGAADGDPVRFSIKRGELDDTIGAKLNRRVLVSGVRRKREDGTVEKHALDVALVDDEPGRERASDSEAPRLRTRLCTYSRASRLAPVRRRDSGIR